MPTVYELLGLTRPLPDEVDTSDIAWCLSRIANIDDDAAWVVIENVHGNGERAATADEQAWYDDARAAALVLMAERKGAPIRGEADSERREAA